MWINGSWILLIEEWNPGSLKLLKLTQLEAIKPMPPPLLHRDVPRQVSDGEAGARWVRDECVTCVTTGVGEAGATRSYEL